FRPEVSYEIDQPFKIESDAVQLKRVFDNLGTNIVKYARKNQPVHFRLYLMGERVYMVQENPISDEKIEVESFGIGVKASQKIVAQMGGDFTYESSNYQYKTGISFEIKKE
ncbi:MAG: ATP-binding protein, partial [Clostridium sp.]